MSSASALCVAVVVGSVRVPLREVVASPEKWGTKQQLQLTGHKTGTGSMLEVQLFLARVGRAVGLNSIEIH